MISKVQGSSVKRQLEVVLFSAIVCCLIPSAEAEAFDGEKSGFVLGMGPGLGWARNDLSIATESKFAVKTDFTLGYGLSNGQTIIAWSNKVLWYDSIGITIASGTMGLGITRFLNQEENSTFFNALIGWNSISAPFESNTPTEYGFGLGLGVGKEFSKNWLVGLDATWGKPGKGFTTFGIGLHFSHLWY